MRLLVTGARAWKDKQLLRDALDLVHVHTTWVTSIVHGGAKGADSMAGAWARSRDVPEWV